MLSDPSLVALHEVVQAVARQTDVRATFSLVAEKARALTGAATAAVMLLDETRTLLDFAAVAGADAAQMVGQTVYAQDALAGNTALTGEMYLVHNTAESQPLLNSVDPDLSFGLGVRSAAVVPIYISGRPAGALAAINHEDNQSFGGDDVLRLQVLANATALAEMVFKLRSEAKSKQRERDILYDAARAISSSLNVQEVLHSVLTTVSESLEMNSGAVFLLNDERTRLYIGADHGMDAEDRDRQLTTESGFAAQIFQSGQPVLIRDTMELENAGDLPLPQARSLLAAPMVSRSNPEGIIVVGSRQAGAYSSEDAQLLFAVANQAAVALENAWLYEDATRRAQEATAIYELSQAVGATLQLDRMLQFVADSVLSLLHVDKFALFLYDTHTASLEIKIARNIQRTTVKSMRPKMGEGIAGWVMEFETPTAVQDVKADHRNRLCPIDTEGVTSLVSVPLQSGDQVIGVIHAMSSRRRLFTVGEMELLYTIANQVGAGIANGQMYEEARQKSAEIRKYVRRVARALGSSLASQQAVQVITDLAMEILEADRSVIYTIDDQGALLPRASSNFKSAMSVIEEGDPANTPAVWVARRGRSLIIEDLNTDTRFPAPQFAARERVCGYLGVPLKVGRSTIGVLEVYTRDLRRFTADEVRLMLTFASQAGVGLQNVLLVEQANRRLADLDFISRISECISGLLDIQELCTEVLPLICEATGSDAGLLRIYADEEPKCVYLRDGTAPADSAILGVLEELAVWVQTFRQSAHLPSPEISSGDAAALAIPLRRSSEQPPLGAVILSRSRPKPPFDNYDRRLVTTLANLLSIRVS